MKTFLLLLISLMTGCDAAADDERCSEINIYKCKYPVKERTYQRIDVFHRSHTGSSKKTNVWENEGTFLLYHDTRKKKLRVVFTQSHKGSDGFQCHFYQTTGSKPEKQKLEEGSCKIHLNIIQTYSSAKTNITCGSYGSRVQFFCKEDGSSCVNILSTSPQASNDRFSLSAGNVSISNVSSQDQGVYWCGLISKDEEDYSAALRKIRLEVQNIIIHKKSFSVGQTLTHWCNYTTNVDDEKFLCKGEDPSGCERLASSSGPESGRFMIQDDAGKRNMTITMRSLRAEDAGTYWCGAESTSGTRRTRGTNRPVIFSRLDLTEASEPPTKSTTSITASEPPTTSTTSITASEPPTKSKTSITASVNSTSSATRGGSAGLTAALVSVAVLLLVLSLVWLYIHFKNRRNVETQVNKEEHGYAEIEELPPKLDPGTAMHMTYVTATFPTNPSAVLHGSTDPAGAGDVVYSTINLPQT